MSTFIAFVCAFIFCYVLLCITAGCILWFIIKRLGIQANNGEITFDMAQSPITT